MNKIEIQDEISKTISDSYLYDGLIHMMSNRNLSFYNQFSFCIEQNSRSIAMTCNFTVVGLREELEHQLGVSIEQSFLNKKFLYNKWQECKTKIIEIICDNNIKLIICQKIFDYKFRIELYKKYSVCVYDQTSILYIHKFCECLNNPTSIENLISLSNFDNSINIGICTNASIMKFDGSKYFCIESESYQTCIIYNPFPEFYDYKSMISILNHPFKIKNNICFFKIIISSFSHYKYKNICFIFQNKLIIFLFLFTLC